MTKKNAALPPLPADTPRSLRPLLQSIRDGMQVQLGQGRGSKLDSAVTFRDLEQLDGVTVSKSGKITSKPTVVPPTEKPVGKPTPPTGIRLYPHWDQVVVSWGKPQYNGHSFTEVYRTAWDGTGTRPGFSDTFLVGAASGTQFVDADVAKETSYLYWIRHVNTNSVAGDLHDPLGDTVTTRVSPQDEIQNATDWVNDSHLTASLRDPIQQINHGELKPGIPGGISGLLDKIDEDVNNVETGLLAQQDKLEKDVADAVLAAETAAGTAGNSADSALAQSERAQAAADAAHEQALGAGNSAGAAASSAAEAAKKQGEAAQAATGAASEQADAAQSAVDAALEQAKAGDAAAAALLHQASAEGAAEAAVVAQTSAEGAATAALSAKGSAEDSATAASASATAAEGSAAAALVSKTEAGESASAASASAAAAEGSASAALAAETDAEGSASAASASATSAAGSASAALASKTEAGKSASAASASATSAAGAASAALTAQTEAEDSAGEASASAATADGAATAALAAKTDAADSASEAGASATAAAGSASAALASKTEAGKSASAASASASSAAGAASAALTAQSEAEDSAGSAAASATSAQGSATAALTAKTTAEGAEDDAVAAASAAATAQTTAEGHASAALTAKNQAAGHASAAGASAEAAEDSAGAALTAKTQAAGHASAASASATAAQGSASAALVAKDEAEDSAGAATASASTAAGAASAALTAKTNAEGAESDAVAAASAAAVAQADAEGSATAALTAQTKAEGAEDSAVAAASAAATAKTTAQGHASAALTAKNQAADHASAASASATAAEGSATAALTAKNNAEGAEDDAAAAASAASASATAAEGSASAALIAKNQATGHASSASASATAAAGSASAALTSKNQAAGHASNASASATSARNSATAALTAQTEAEDSAGSAAAFATAADGHAAAALEASQSTDSSKGSAMLYAQSAEDSASAAIAASTEAEGWAGSASQSAAVAEGHAETVTQVYLRSNPIPEANNIFHILDWKPGTSGNQAGTDESKAAWSANGSSAESVIVEGLGPLGADALWECRPNSASDADGGWNKDFLVDATKTYRVSVWVQRKKTGVGNFYLGCSTVHTENLSGTANDNPYFFAGSFANVLEAEKWYLAVGVIHPAGYTGGDTGVAGIYDPATGAKVVEGTEYRMKAGAKRQTQRCYLYYCTDTAQRQWMALPRAEVLNASAPSLESMFNSALTSRVGAVEERTQVVEDDLGNIKSEWTVKVDANGVVGGIGLVGDSETGRSAVVIAADRFAIVDPKTDPNTQNALVPFSVDTERMRVVMQSATVVDLDADGLAAGTAHAQELVVSERLSLPLGGVLETMLDSDFLRSLVRQNFDAVESGGVAKGSGQGRDDVYSWSVQATPKFVSGGAPVKISAATTGISKYNNGRTNPNKPVTVTTRLTRDGSTLRDEFGNLCEHTQEFDWIAVVTTYEEHQGDGHYETVRVTSYWLNVEAHSFNVSDISPLASASHQYAVEFEITGAGVAYVNPANFKTTIAASEPIGSSGGVYVNTNWGDIRGKPSTFPPSNFDASKMTSGVLPGARLPITHAPSTGSDTTRVATAGYSFSAMAKANSAYSLAQQAQQTASGKWTAVNASTTAKGIVQLSTATNSTSTALAATASAVKAAYDRGSVGVSNAATAKSRADAAYGLAEDAGADANAAYDMGQDAIGTANAAQARADAAYSLAGTKITQATADGRYLGKTATATAASRLFEKSDITFGWAGLQVTDLSGAGGTGLNGATPTNPTNDWWHHLIVNHANSTGYYTDIATCFHSDRILFRRCTGGTLTPWYELYHTGQKPTKGDIGLGNVNNWGATSSVSSTSTSTYAVAAGVKTAYDRGSLGVANAATAQARADSAYTLAGTKMTQATADGRYLAKGAKAADAEKLDGIDSSLVFHTKHLPTWGEVAGKPSSFTPSAHNQAWSTITGVPNASTSAKGIVQLSTATNSTSTALAATASAAKAAYDRGSTGVANAATAQARADLAYSMADDAYNSAEASYHRSVEALENAATAQARADAAYTLAGTKITQAQGDARYLGVNGNAKTATWADTVDVNVSNSTSFFNLLWHSGDTVFGTNGMIGFRPSDGKLYLAGTPTEFTTPQTLTTTSYHSMLRFPAITSTSNSTQKFRSMMQWTHGLNNGYRSVFAIGSVRTSGWDGGMFFGVGTHDDKMDSYFRLGCNGDITYHGESSVAVDHTFYHTGRKPSKADVGLGSVNNWGATTAVNSTSATTYATASAVKTAYDRGSLGVSNAAAALSVANDAYEAAQDAHALAGTKLTQATADGRYLAKGAKAADAEKLDGIDSSLVFHTKHLPTWGEIAGKPSYFEGERLRIHDTRNTTYTPDQLPSHRVMGHFTTQQMPPSGGWVSKLSVKGWSAGYAAWELGSFASNTVGDGKLWFRHGVGATWQAWDMVFTTRHKPTKSDVGLGNVNNWGATTSVSSTSTTTYATASAVKLAYDRAGHAHPYLPSSGGRITSNLYINDLRRLYLGNSNDVSLMWNGYDMITTVSTATGKYRIQGISGGDYMTLYMNTGDLFCRGNVKGYYTSDERLKRNIRPIRNALRKVGTLRAATYDKRDLESGRYLPETGLIAQDVMRVLPHAVHRRDDGILTLQQGGFELVALLVAAIQDLNTELTELRARAA